MKKNNLATIAVLSIIPFVSKSRNPFSSVYGNVDIGKIALTHIPGAIADPARFPKNNIN